MKNISFLFILGCTLSLSAQKGNTMFTQQEWLEKASNFKAARDDERTMKAYYYAYKEDPETPAGKAALHKSDSLKTLLRNKILSDIQGTWKLDKSGSNWGYKEADSDSLYQNTLNITGNDVTYYQTNRTTGKREVVQKEKLRFTDLEDDSYHYVLQFVYQDNQVWDLSVKDSKLYIFQIGEMYRDTVSTIVCGNAEYYYTKVED